jgi:hypothetical protein
MLSSINCCGGRARNCPRRRWRRDYAARMRSVGVLVLLIAGLALALLDTGRRGPGPPRPALVSPEQAEAERALTLLDVWSQSLVPSLPLEHARALAIRSGRHVHAAALDRRVRPALLRAEGFLEDIARDPTLRSSDSIDVQALRAAAVAWADWAAAALTQTGSPRDLPAPALTRLEQRAVRLHQSAYAIVDGSLRGS